MDKPVDPNVRILTLNCWGLKFVSSKRSARIEAIAKRLYESADKYDVIALQEVWVEEDYNILRDSVKHYLRFAKRWYSGIITGPGLVVFSRWPIESTWIYRFPLNGRPSAFWRGDWYVGKAAGSCVIKHPSGRKLEIINAHLHAPYAPSGDANYACHRASQAWDMTGIVWRAILSGHVVFVTGDLNARPQSVSLRLFEQHLSDAWMVSRANLDHVDDVPEYTTDQLAKLTPQEQIEKAGVTSNSQLNTWRKNYSLDRAKRLDYIFYDSAEAEVQSAKVTFTEAIPGVGSVSDHFAFTATFKILNTGFGNTLGVLSPMGRRRRKTVSGGETLRNLQNELLQLIHDYRPVAAKQVRWRLCHFYVSMLYCVGVLVSVWWGAAQNRAYVGFIFILTSLLVAISGVLDGLLGYLFGNNEHRALIEFEEQVRLSQEHLQIVS